MHSGARCKVLRCVEWGGPKRAPRQSRKPTTPYGEVVDQRVQGNATLTAGSLKYSHVCHALLHILCVILGDQQAPTDRIQHVKSTKKALHD